MKQLSKRRKLILVLALVSAGALFAFVASLAIARFAGTLLEPTYSLYLNPRTSPDGSLVAATASRTVYPLPAPPRIEFAVAVGGRRLHHAEVSTS
jgi:hypothetical protein